MEHKNWNLENQNWIIINDSKQNNEPKLLAKPTIFQKHQEDSLSMLQQDSIVYIGHYATVKKIEKDKNSILVEFFDHSQKEVSADLIQTNICVQAVLVLKKIKVEFALILNVNDSVQQITEKTLQNLKHMYGKDMNIKQKSLFLVHKDKAYDAFDEIQIHQLDIRKDQKILLVSKCQLIDCSIKRYTLSTVYQGEYLHRDCKKDICFKPSRFIYVTGISLYSLDLNHHDCGYQEPAQVVISVYPGKEFVQSSVIYTTNYELLYKAMESPESQNTDEKRLSQQKLTFEPIPVQQDSWIGFRLNYKSYTYLFSCQGELKKSIIDEYGVVFDIDQRQDNYYNKCISQLHYQIEE